jgi:hypothetical protein
MPTMPIRPTANAALRRVNIARLPADFRRSSFSGRFSCASLGSLFSGIPLTFFVLVYMVVSIDEKPQMRKSGEQAR